MSSQRFFFYIPYQWNGIHVKLTSIIYRNIVGSCGIHCAAYGPMCGITQPIDNIGYNDGNQWPHIFTSDRPTTSGNSTRNCIVDNTED